MKRFEYDPWERDGNNYIKGNWTLPTRDVNVSTMHKKLSDAECAAEYWETRYRANSALEQTYPYYDDEHPLNTRPPQTKPIPGDASWKHPTLLKEHTNA